MGQLAIDILWLLIGIIILAGVVWLAIWVVNNFIYQIPARVEQGIWVIVLLLVLIAVISMVIGGGVHKPSWLRGDNGPALGSVVYADAVSTVHSVSRLLRC